MDTSLVFRVDFFILLAVMLVIRIYFNIRIRSSGERIMPDRQAIQREGVGLFAIRFVSFFVLIAVLVLYAINHAWIKTLDFALPAGLRWLGFAIGLPSIALTAWTEVVLGRQYSAQVQLRQEHQLVTSGPYAWVRHPHYTALYGFGLSLALVSANWVFIAFFVLALSLFFRIPREEKMMLDQFGDEYRDYMQRTGRFFPKI